jgi:hypothetical protein
MQTMTNTPQTTAQQAEGRDTSRGKPKTSWILQQLDGRKQHRYALGFCICVYVCFIFGCDSNTCRMSLHIFALWGSTFWCLLRYADVVALQFVIVCNCSFCLPSLHLLHRGALVVFCIRLHVFFVHVWVVNN